MTPSEFLADPDFVAFASESEETIAKWLVKAAPFFNVDRWGPWYSEGIGNWIAHRIVMSNLRATQPTNSMDAGDTASNSMMINAQAKDPYMRTSYGQEFCRLRRLVGMGGFAA
jgi:hypothetical protein